MIDLNDLHKGSRVQVFDGTCRSWRTLGRSRPVWRTVFMGYIDSVGVSYGSTDLRMVDTASRLSRTRLHG